MKEVNRVKALLINDSNEIMLGYCNNQYQFPGGHVEENETLNEALEREIKEETGIIIDVKKLTPFFKIHYNLKENELNIYYYLIHCNDNVNYQNVNYTNLELAGDYKLIYVHLEEVENVLMNNINSNPKNRFIVPEMLKALEEYKKSGGNMKDISIMIDDVKLNVRVGAILKYNNKILIEKNDNVDFIVLPGGRVKTLENSKNALIRELKEELNINIENETFKLISLIENFFSYDGKKCHEIYYIYEILLTKDYGIKDGMNNLDSSSSKYYFKNIEEIKSIKMLPQKLKEVIELKEFKSYFVNEI